MYANGDAKQIIGLAWLFFGMTRFSGESQSIAW